VIPDAPLVEAPSKLAARGYQSLDDFVYHERFRPLLGGPCRQSRHSAHGTARLQAEWIIYEIPVKLLAESGNA
jgi:hypothetical protein